MRNSTLLYGRVLLWIAYGSKSKLESLNYNLNVNLNAYRLRIYLINTNIIF